MKLNYNKYENNFICYSDSATDYKILNIKKKYSIKKDLIFPA